MLFLLWWYLYSRFPKYRRAFRLVFDPDGFHHYPKELQSQVETLSQEEMVHSFVPALAAYRNKPDAQLQETYATLARVIIQLPVILDTIIEMVHKTSFSFSEKKKLIAIVAYLVCAIDVIPEKALGGAGFADDAICVSIGLNAFFSEANHDKEKKLWSGDAELLENIQRLNVLSQENLPSLYSEVRGAYMKIFA